MNFQIFYQKITEKQLRKKPSKWRKFPEKWRKFPEQVLPIFLKVLMAFFAIICWPSGSKRRMRNQSFLSSSSTLGEGLEVMSRPVDDLVGTSFPLDGEERALRARLEDIWAWSVLWLQVGDNLWLFFSMICWEYSRIKHLSTLTTLSHCIPLCCSRKSMASWMPSSPPRLRSHMWHLQRQDMGVE